LELIDADGQPVLVPTPEGEQQLAIDGQFQVTPAPGIKPGTPIDAMAAINMPPQLIPAGGRCEWRLMLDGQSHEDWRLAFSTRAAQAQAA
jgi:hypothetical protein